MSNELEQLLAQADCVVNQLDALISIKGNISEADEAKIIGFFSSIQINQLREDLNQMVERVK